MAVYIILTLVQEKKTKSSLTRRWYQLLLVPVHNSWQQANIARSSCKNYKFGRSFYMKNKYDKLVREQKPASLPQGGRKKQNFYKKFSTEKGGSVVSKTQKQNLDLFDNIKICILAWIKSVEPLNLQLWHASTKV